MTVKREIGSELDSLKNDIEALLKKYGEESYSHIASKISSEFNGMRGVIEDTFDAADSEISKHPILTILGAAALGYLVGRIAAR